EALRPGAAAARTRRARRGAALPFARADAEPQQQRRRLLLEQRAGAVHVRRERAALRAVPRGHARAAALVPRARREAARRAARLARRGLGGVHGRPRAAARARQAGVPRAERAAGPPAGAARAEEERRPLRRAPPAELQELGLRRVD